MKFQVGDKYWDGNIDMGSENLRVFNTRQTKEEAIQDIEMAVLSDREKDRAVAWVEEWIVDTTDEDEPDNIGSATSTGNYEDVLL